MLHWVHSHFVGFVMRRLRYTLIIQALDDIIPEIRTVYTLQINSATGGAIVSKVTGAATANVVFVASDFPHGEFVFDMSQSVITTEDQYSVSLVKSYSTYI